MNENPSDLLVGNFEDFFERSLNGYAIARPDGKLVRINAKLASWFGYEPDDAVGRPFADHLSIGAKIYYETHLASLMTMQGFFDEIAVELKAKDGARLPVFVNAYTRKNDAGEPLFVRLTVFKALDRQRYEDNLRQARKSAEAVLENERQTAKLREQFIAVLGHDLRNPLAAISTGADMLLKMPLEQRAMAITTLIQGSVRRMGALIDDVMDFARGGLGGDIALNRQEVDMQPILQHVVDELKTAHSTRDIQADISIERPIGCDPSRLSQLLSNLLANAITHGAPEGTIRVFAGIDGATFTMWVGNPGKPIAPAAISRLFMPFEREEVRASQNGLGLGLYIASEIARSHGGSLGVTSDETETRFTFVMPV